MATLPAGTDRATLVRVRTKEPLEGHDAPTEFIVGAAYLEAFPDEVDFVRFAEETEETAAAREEKQAAAEAEAEAATKVATTKTPATQGSGGSGRSDF